MMISSPVAEALAAKNGSAVRRFNSLKIRAGAWIVVPRSGTMLKDGLSIYNPQNLSGMMLKAVVQRGVWWRSVFLSDDAVSDLEHVLSQALGGQPVNCVFYFRSPGAFSKSIILVLDRTGNALAYVKIGTTKESKLAIENEENILKRISDFPTLASQIPSVLGRTAWRGFPMLIVSVGSSHRSCHSFGIEHERFLCHLRKATLNHRSLKSTMPWQKTLGRFNFLSKTLSRSQVALYERALTEVEARFSTKPLATCLAHRDFVPWNMHYGRNGHIFVFDWELAQDQTIQGWDMFHYHLAQRAMRHGRLGREIFERIKRSAEGNELSDYEGHMLFYLVDIALFLHDRIARAPAIQGNRYLRLVEYEIQMRYASVQARGKAGFVHLSQPRLGESFER